MQIKKTRFTSLFTLLPAILLGGWVACVDNAVGAQAPSSYELTIRPSICVSYDSEQPCSMTLNISWTGGSNESVCLNTETQPDYITCWNNVSSGTIEVPYENSSNVVYQLVSMQNNQVLANAQVQVISRDLRDSRRRRRHVWSIL